MSDADFLNEEFARKFPEAFAKLLMRGATTDIAGILDGLAPAVAASVAARLPVRVINALLSGGVAQPETWLSAAAFDDAVVLLGPLPRERCLTLINGLQNRTLRHRLLQFINYPTHSVGALVSDTVVGIQADLPVADVLAELRALDEGHVPPVVVIDDHGHYVGVLDIWRLLIRQPQLGCAADYAASVTPLRPEAPIASAAQAAQWGSHTWLPVVDHEQRVLGTVSRQRLVHSIGAAAEAAPVLQESIADLGMQLLRVLSDLLDRVLSPRSTP